MLVTAERPTALQIAGRSWRSLFSATRQLSPLFLVCLVLLIALASRSQWLPGYQAWLTELSGGRLNMQRMLFSIALSDIIGLILLAPLAVAVHRFILLGEDRNQLYFFNRTALRFALLLVLFEAAKLFSTYLSLLGTPSAVTFLYNVIYGIVACWTLLIFPAVALEEKQAGGLFTTATTRAQGNFWLIFRSLFLTIFLPGLVWGILNFGYNILLTRMLRAGIPQPVLSACYVLVNNGFKIALVGLGAAAASHLYSYAAHRPLESEALPAEV